MRQHRHAQQLIISLAGLALLGPFACTSETNMPDTAQAPAYILPVIVLDVPGMAPRDFTRFGPKVPGTMRVVENHDGRHKEARDLVTRPASMETKIGIRMRGNSSQSYPLVTWAMNATGFHQRSYSIEMRTAQDQPRDDKVLGMPSDPDWALVPCWNDKTCMRNAITYRIGQELGRWNPRLRFVEVYFNEEYIGIYQFVEPTRRTKDRVDLPKVAEEPGKGDITGAYIFRREGPGRKSATAGPPIMDWVSPTQAPGVYKHQQVYSYHDPSEETITAAQRNYLQQYVADFETMMQSPDWNSPQTGYPAKIDVMSWVDYGIMNELSHNIDSYWKSMYFVKQPDSMGGKLMVSPLWDFNMGYGNADYRDGWRTDRLNYRIMLDFGGECDYQQRTPREPPFCDVGCCTAACVAPMRCWNMPVVPFYWDNLWKDPAFLAQVKCRYQDLRKGPLKMSFIDARIEEWRRELAPLAMPRHLAKWPELLKSVWANPYKIDPTSAPIPGETNEEFFDREVLWFRNWIAARLNFLDAALPGTCNRPPASN